MADKVVSEFIAELLQPQQPPHERELFTVQSQPLNQEEIKLWTHWIASPCLSFALDTLLCLAKSRAVDAIKDSLLIAANTQTASRATDLCDRRDDTWREVEKILFAYRLLMAIRDGKIEPVKLKE